MPVVYRPASAPESATAALLQVRVSSSIGGGVGEVVICVRTPGRLVSKFPRELEADPNRSEVFLAGGGRLPRGTRLGQFLTGIRSVALLLEKG